MHRIRKTFCILRIPALLHQIILMMFAKPSFLWSQPDLIALPVR